MFGSLYSLITNKILLVFKSFFPNNFFDFGVVDDFLSLELHIAFHLALVSLMSLLCCRTLTHGGGLGVNCLRAYKVHTQLLKNVIIVSRHDSRRNLLMVVRNGALHRKFKDRRHLPALHLRVIVGFADDWACVSRVDVYLHLAGMLGGVVS